MCTEEIITIHICCKTRQEIQTVEDGEGNGECGNCECCKDEDGFDVIAK